MIPQIFKLILQIINPIHMAKNIGGCIIRIDLAKLKAVIRISHLNETAIIWEDIDPQTHTNKRETYDLTSHQHDILIAKLRLISNKLELQRESNNKNIVTDFHIFVDPAEPTQ